LELSIQLPDGEQRVAITGPAERNLKIIRESLGIVINARHGALLLRGDDMAVTQAAHLIKN